MNNKNKLKLDSFKDVSIDNIEAVLDSLLQDELFKNIPVLKNILSLYKTGKSIRDCLLVRKIYAFIENIKDISQEEINKYIDKMKDTKKRNEIGMKILQIIDKLDDERKACLIGELFKKMIKQEIDKPTYFRLCYIIDKSYYDDICQLKELKNKDTIISNNICIDEVVLENLFSNGLLNRIGISGGSANDDGGVIYQLNTYGIIVADLL